MKKMCVICQIDKHEKAYLGGRSVCRVCWIYLTPEDKERHHIVPKHLRDKNAKYQRERSAKISLFLKRSSQ
jgi:hypothetical protein